MAKQSSVADLVQSIRNATTPNGGIIPPKVNTLPSGVNLGNTSLSVIGQPAGQPGTLNRGTPGRGNSSPPPLSGTAYHGPLEYHPAVGLHFKAFAPIAKKALLPEPVTQ